MAAESSDAFCPCNSSFEPFQVLRGALVWVSGRPLANYRLGKAGTREARKNGVSHVLVTVRLPVC